MDEIFVNAKDVVISTTAMASVISDKKASSQLACSSVHEAGRQSREPDEWHVCVCGA